MSEHSHMGMQQPKNTKFILYSQTLLYLFYQSILQLTIYPNFYFYIQPNKLYNKIIKNIIFSLFPSLTFSLHTQPHIKLNSLGYKIMLIF